MASSGRSWASSGLTTVMKASAGARRRNAEENVVIMGAEIPREPLLAATARLGYWSAMEDQ